MTASLSPGSKEAGGSRGPKGEVRTCLVSPLGFWGVLGPTCPANQLSMSFASAGTAHSPHPPCPPVTVTRSWTGVRRRGQALVFLPHLAGRLPSKPQGRSEVGETPGGPWTGGQGGWQIPLSPLSLPGHPAPLGAWPMNRAFLEEEDWLSGSAAGAQACEPAGWAQRSLHLPIPIGSPHRRQCRPHWGGPGCLPLAIITQAPTGTRPGVSPRAQTWGLRHLWGRL